MIRRRDFITLVGGAAAAWPLAARAQQPSKARRIGVLTGGFGPDSQARLEAFLKALAQLGWTDGQNVRLEIRRGGGDADAIRRYAIGGARAGRHHGRGRYGNGGVASGDPLGADRVCNRAPIQSALVSSQACRGRAATAQASCNSNTA